MRQVLNGFQPEGALVEPLRERLPPEGVDDGAPPLEVAHAHQLLHAAVDVGSIADAGVAGVPVRAAAGPARPPAAPPRRRQAHRRVGALCRRGRPLVVVVVEQPHLLRLLQGLQRGGEALAKK